jgi:hypothetical protein
MMPVMPSSSANASVASAIQSVILRSIVICEVSGNTLVSAVRAPLGLKLNRAALP